MTPDTLELDLIADLQANVTETIRHQQGGSEVEASKLAERIIDNLRRTYGGEAIYIPKGPTLRDRAARDRDIRRRFNGNNIGELIQKTGLSRSQIYRIVGRQAGHCLRME